MAVLLAPLVVVLATVPQARALPPATFSNALIVAPTLLLVAAVLYYHWSMSADHVAGWLVLGLTLVGVQGIAVPVLSYGASHQSWLALTDLLLGVAVLVLARNGRHAPLYADPLALGLALGVGVIGLRLAGVTVLPEWQPSPATVAVLGAGILVVHAAIARAVLQVESAPSWLRSRIAGTAMLLGISQVAANLAPPWLDSDAVAALALVTAVGCVVLLITAGLMQLRILLGHDSTMAELHQQLQTIEAGVRLERARIHEINATLAGISSASQLIHSQTELSWQRRQLLEQMMQSELGRLQRLLCEPQSGHTVDLDEAVRHLVIAHETRGHQVRWRPTGVWVRGSSDAVTELVSILLDNAFQHGATQASVEVHAAGHVVEVHVADDGRGIEAALVPHLFEWGARGPSSHGQGIGLCIAHQLAADQDGALRLFGTSAQGSTFVIELVAARNMGAGRGAVASTA